MMARQNGRPWEKLVYLDQQKKSNKKILKLLEFDWHAVFRPTTISFPSTVMGYHTSPARNNGTRTTNNP